MAAGSGKKYAGIYGEGRDIEGDAEGENGNESLGIREEVRGGKRGRIGKEMLGRSKG